VRQVVRVRRVPPQRLQQRDRVVGGLHHPHRGYAAQPGGEGLLDEGDPRVPALGTATALAGRDLGQAPGLAAATGAYLCFEDEAGQSLRPPKARTWAPTSTRPKVPGQT
jgi:hypothetical protein